MQTPRAKVGALEGWNFSPSENQGNLRPKRLGGLPKARQPTYPTGWSEPKEQELPACRPHRGTSFLASQLKSGHQGWVVLGKLQAGC